MTRVLWVTAEPPDPARSGGSIRQAHLLRALGLHAETHLLVAGHVEDAATRDGLAGLTEVPVPGSGQVHGRAWWRLERLRGALTESEPHEVVVSRPLREALRAGMLALPTFDITIVEHSWMASLLNRRRGGRWMIDLQQPGYGVTRDFKIAVEKEDVAGGVAHRVFDDGALRIEPQPTRSSK